MGEEFNGGFLLDARCEEPYILLVLEFAPPMSYWFLPELRVWGVWCCRLKALVERKLQLLEDTGSSSKLTPGQKKTKEYSWIF